MIKNKRRKSDEVVWCKIFVRYYNCVFQCQNDCLILWGLYFNYDSASYYRYNCLCHIFDINKTRSHILFYK